MAVFLFLLPFCLPLAQAKAIDGLAICVYSTSEFDQTGKRIVSALKSEFPHAQSCYVTDKQRKLDIQQSINISVGRSALASLLNSHINGRIVAVSLTSSDFHDILKFSANNSVLIDSAIFSDPAPIDQFSLVEKMFPFGVSAAILVKPSTQFGDILPHNANVSKVQWRIESMQDKSDALDSLNHTSDVGVIVALPGSEVFEGATLRDAFLLTFRRRQFVIGYSSDLVQNGAVASIVSDQDDINSQLIEMLKNYDRNKTLPAPSHPSYFRVVVNDKVAEALHFQFPDSARNFSHQPQRRQQ